MADNLELEFINIMNRGTNVTENTSREEGSLLKMNQEANFRKSTNQEECSSEKINQEEELPHKMNDEEGTKYRTNLGEVSSHNTDQEKGSSLKTDQVEVSSQAANQEEGPPHKKDQVEGSSRVANHEEDSSQQTNQEDLRRQAHQEEAMKTKENTVPLINIKVKQKGKKDVYFKIKTNTELRKLMHSYCDHQSVEYNTFVFIHKGRRCRPGQMPQDLKIKDGDEIEAMLPLYGG